MILTLLLLFLSYSAVVEQEAQYTSESNYQLNSQPNNDWRLDFLQMESFYKLHGDSLRREEVTDTRVFLRERFHESPLYTETKSFFDWEMWSDSSGGRGEESLLGDLGSRGFLGFRNVLSMPSLRIDPVRGRAVIRYRGILDANLIYDQYVQLHFMQKLNYRSRLDLRLKPERDEAMIHYFFTW